MAETANQYMDRLAFGRGLARDAAALVRRLANDASADHLGERRAAAARALAASIKAIGSEIVAEAEKLERKL